MSEDRGTLPAQPGLPRVHTRQELAQNRMSQLGPVVIVVLGAIDLKNTVSAAHVAHLAAIMVAVGVFMVAGALGLATRTASMRRPWGTLAAVHAGGLIGLAAASVTLSFLQPGLTGDLGLLLAMAASVPLLPLLVSAILALAGAVVVGVTAGLHGESVLSAGLSGLAFAAGYVIIRLSRRIRQSSDEAEVMHRQATALAERQRLAREMHDVLAHSLSGLMLQLEGARLLATRDPVDPRLPDTIERAHHLARAGLTEARRAIGMLREIGRAPCRERV